MAYKIKIKHNISGKTIPLTLKYDDPSLNLIVGDVEIISGGSKDGRVTITE